MFQSSRKKQGKSSTFASTTLGDDTREGIVDLPTAEKEEKEEDVERPEQAVDKRTFRFSHKRNEESTSSQVSSPSKVKWMIYLTLALVFGFGGGILGGFFVIFKEKDKEDDKVSPNHEEIAQNEPYKDYSGSFVTTERLANFTFRNPVPCGPADDCARVYEAIDAQYPPSARQALFRPDSCAFWARDWVRSSKDVKEWSLTRIRQRFAMAVFYCELDGNNWKERTNWMTELHECDWSILLPPTINDVCNEQEEYYILYLPENSLKGTLPPEVSMLTSLNRIDLSNNVISGNIPFEWGRLKKLDTLILSNNGFTKSPLPTALNSLTNLAHLDLSYNQFEGNIPNVMVQNMPDLQRLYLQHNDLTGPLPVAIDNLYWQHLYLHDNEFSDTLSNNITSPEMQELLLHNNKLEGEFPVDAFVDNIGNLRKLTLYGNDLMAGDLDSLCSLLPSTTLESIVVDLDQISCNCCGVEPAT